MPVAKSHNIDRVLASFFATPWAITPQKLNDILAFLDRRKDGPLTAEELAAFAPSAADGPSEKPYQVTAGGVAILPLSGVIAQRLNLVQRFSGGTSTEQFSAALQAALEDPAVKAVVLDVNSPGGSVGGVAEVSDQIFAARDGNKPIVAVANTQMASAAYWIGSAAGQVVASPSATVGSIGVYMIHADRSRMDEALGVRRSVIAAGRYKTVGNDAEPLSAESRAKLQEYVDAAYGLFIEAVARNRNTKPAAVKGGYGEGDVLFARDAKAAGLVDRVATLQQVVDELEKSFRPAGAAGIHSPTSHLGAKGNPMDKKLVAALFVRGLITDTTEEAAKAYFAAQNEAAPATAAETAACLARLMPPAGDEPPKTKKPADPPAVTVDAVADAVVAKLNAQKSAEASALAEQTRACCELVGLDEKATAELATRKLPLADVQKEIRRVLSGINEPVPQVQFSATGSELEKFGAVAQEALDARCLNAANPAWAVSRDKLSGGARQLFGFSLIELAAESLRRMGIRTQGMSRMEIARLALASDNPAIMASAGAGAYFGTASFANLTLNSARKSLTRAYQEAPVSCRKWVRQGDPVVDFKLNSIVKFGEVGDLENIPEGRDYPEETGLSDDREYYVVETFGKVISFTRQLMLNDDLSALSRLPQLLGNSAARTFNKAVYKILTGNPDMADAVALFHASSHGANLLGTGSTTAAPPSTATMQLISSCMRGQHGLNTDTYLNTAPRFVIVPVALEGTTKSYCRSQSDPASSNAGVISPYYGELEPVVESLLDADSVHKWYAAADAGQIDTIELRFLQGEETPYMESWIDNDNDARKFKVRQTGAAVLVDYRGLVEHTGYSA